MFVQAKFVFDPANFPIESNSQRIRSDAKPLTQLLPAHVSRSFVRDKLFVRAETIEHHFQKLSTFNFHARCVRLQCWIDLAHIRINEPGAIPFLSMLLPDSFANFVLGHYCKQAQQFLR
jgi:hypothetical protein